MFQEYDVIVVGGGHAGCEAAAAASNMGAQVLLITMNMQTIAQMSCNPAMGGIAKGQIVREIDALGGYSGIVTDRSTIQFRMLNKSKGPAMWSPRSQNDRMLFAQEWRKMLENNVNLDFWQDTVNELIIEKNVVKGIKTQMGYEILAKTVILTNGTFLNGVIHIGEKKFGGGRVGERAVGGLTENLIELGFQSGRMKTGTPPRVDGRTLDYSKMEEQYGDKEPKRFSYMDVPLLVEKRNCHITYTNPDVHKALKKGIDRSPMFTGRIKGTGPRYCPSIEDKIHRFSERNAHQIFVEPEGLNTIEVYVNGFSTSLPEEVQYNALKKVPGFENVKMFRPGYAIEYDYFSPTQLQLSLETKKIKNLFLAGQINGTTGYEEAACQGLISGINAVHNIRLKEPFILSRSEAYIGVLIDDLINKGTDEPYRMFTSRAEYRILLRQDNADIRLTKKGFEIGLAKKERLKRVEQKQTEVEEITGYFKQNSIDPLTINGLLNKLDSAEIKQKTKLSKLISRPRVSISLLAEHFNALGQYLSIYDQESIEQAEIKFKYEGYIEKEQELVNKMSKLESLKLIPEFNYDKVNALSSEGREKLSKIKPRTIGQASRISGVTPSDISVLMVHLGR